MYAVRFSNKLSRKCANLIFVTGLSVSALIGFVEYQQTASIARLDHLFLDTFLKCSASGKPAQNIVVIDIDEMSLSAVGQWPWPRYRMASLIETIATGKPAAIGLDVLFSEPDRSSLANIQQTFKRDFGVDVSFTGAPAGLLDNDGYFGYVLSQAGAVGSKYFYFDHGSKTEVSAKSELRFGGHTDLLSLNDASGVLLNTYAIASQTKLSGFINNQPDEDGMLRRLPLLIQHNGVIHANLALASVMKSSGTASASIEWDRSGPLIQVGSHRIPIDEKGFALLRFNGGPHLYPAISALDILNGTFREADIKGKIVFVGSSAAGLNDLHSTAFDSQFPGSKVQAVMAENIATGHFVREPGWASKAIFVGCIVTGALMSALFIAASGAFQILLGSTVLAGFLVLIGALFFGHAGMFVSPGASILVAGILFVLFSVARFAMEKRHAHIWFKRLGNARQVTIESMAAVAETRDPETGAHIKRTQHYVKAIAEQLMRSGYYTNILTEEYIDLLFISAPLHDVGKVGVPDHILLKPGKLTDEEYVVMKQHAELGRRIIFSTAQRIEGDNFLTIAGEIAATHHEKWDGTGYPLGLAGQEIPLSGRIMSVADIYDALISRRCYKEPFPHEKATSFMREASGKTFDPVVLDAFFSIEDKIKEIAAKYRDEEEAVVGRGNPATGLVSAPLPSAIIDRCIASSQYSRSEA
jgi:HD-GYP domain-containing protein (c-di-GMP phosphodiesterase class II)